MSESLLGLKVPQFTASSTSEKPFSLENYFGSPLVLYFYPKDNTPGCTAETLQFNELHSDFEKLNCTIIGISKDSISSHRKFISKFNLVFDLISDEEGQICDMFGVMKMKNMYGKKYLGIERSTFLVDREQRVVSEWRKVKVPGHAAEVLKSVKSL